MNNDFIQALNLLINLDENLYEIINTSLFISLSATAIASILAIAIAGFLATSKFFLRRNIIAILNALTGIPPVVLGLAVYLLLSRSGPFGAYGILFTKNAMIVTQTFLVLPIIASSVQVVASLKYNSLEPYFKMLKVTKINVVLSVMYEIRFSILTAVMFGLARALSEVGAMLIVGGNIFGETRIMTTAISLETSKGNLGFALALGFILIVIILAINLTSSAVNGYLEMRNER